MASSKLATKLVGELKSWKPSVLVQGEWATNGLAFATREEAEASANDLYRRWALTLGAKAVESDEPVNYKLDLETGKVYRLDEQGNPVGEGYKAPDRVQL